ncbi:MAG: DUF488 domain-containing protein [Methanobacterium sp.]|jgi:uncharacterized protein (DUF488 family)
MKIYTIGFTKKSAEKFFKILKDNDIKQIVDVRLNNTSQLAGFTKKNDLEYFLQEIANIKYYHFDFLTPTKEMRKHVDNWDLYTKEYLDLMEDRKILGKLDREFFKKRTCLLCSEPSPDHCHRGILSDYLKKHWENVKVVHL